MLKKSIKFKEYKKLDFKKITIDISKYWNDNDIHNKSLRNIGKKKCSKRYVLYEGPPSLNGSPGIHHVFSRTIKDIFCRFFSLKGRKIFRKSGWDVHGLPIELSVEKEIGIKKNDIGQKISIEAYNNLCEKLIKKSLKKWITFTKKIGYWIDLKNFFITSSSKYIETVWWLLKNIYKKNLIYNGYSIQPYSPAAGTGLSYHELNMPGTYKKIRQISPIVKFKSVKETLPKKYRNISGNIYFLSWTTTPWTLPANTALSVGENINYIIVKIKDKTGIFDNIIFSEKLINNILPRKYFFRVNNEIEMKKYFNKNIPYYVIGEFKGKDLFKSKYEQLISWVKPFNSKNAFQIVKGDFINSEEGTGIVHIAPTFGMEDFFLSKKYNIPPMMVSLKNKLQPIVDLDGKFIEILPYNFGGKYIKNELSPSKENNFSVDEKIISFLEKKRKIFRVDNYYHSYPHCWRTEKPIIYYPLQSWFMKTEEIKNDMILLNHKINWIPGNYGRKKFNFWLKNIKNWNLSRSRYWGTPIPIWKTKDGEEKIIIGSIKELILEIKKSIDHGFMSSNIFKNFIIDDMSDENYKKINLHKDVLDKIILISPKNKKPMKRDPDLLDVWFDSGSMPYAQFHYPFENKNFIDKNIFFPSDFISEGIDQTRGWFFTLHAISSSVFKSISYKNVISTGLVLDKKGKKMSKSKGNFINANDLIDNYGADVIRWYMIYNSEPWNNLKFNIKEIEISVKKFFNTLYNVYSFFALYANIDGFNYKECDKNFRNIYTDIDLWIISELNTTIRKTEKYYSEYNPTKSARIISSFVIDKLSNWYIRLCRKRFWKEKYTDNKIIAYQILYKCLICISKISSPIIPFFSERIFLDLNSVTKKEKYESIHLSNFPTFNINLIDVELENAMSLVRKVISMIFSIRKKNNIKIRYPLSKSIIISSEEKEIKQLKRLSNIIKKEANIKNIDFTSSSNDFKIIKYAKPNYRKLGPRFGKKTVKICNIISKLTNNNIEDIEKHGKICLNFLGKKISIFLDEIKIFTSGLKNWKICSSNNLIVALDLTINENLLKEGFIKDIIRCIQKLRKENKYEITKKILIYINTNQKIKSIIMHKKKHLCRETLANKICFYKGNNGTKILFQKEVVFIKINRDK